MAESSFYDNANLPAILALLSAGQGMIGQPSRMPQTFSQSIGAGIGGGLNGLMLAEQMKRQGIAGDLQAEQLKELRAKRDFDKAIASMDFTKTGTVMGQAPAEWAGQTTGEDYGATDVMGNVPVETRIPMSMKERLGEVISKGLQLPGGVEQVGKYATLYKALAPTLHNVTQGGAVIDDNGNVVFKSEPKLDDPISKLQAGRLAASGRGEDTTHWDKAIKLATTRAEKTEPLYEKWLSGNAEDRKDITAFKQAGQKSDKDTAAETAKKVSATINAKVATWEEQLGRKLSPEEKRYMALRDLYGIVPGNEAPPADKAPTSGYVYINGKLVKK